ncbi:aldehyde dehydrogenase (NAD(P)(+)) ald5 [Phlyctochytrium bullatum]|nr:aldehyde dehydrogenase (NAD(P)(+)) ald5 [Phlyctochytrium bullatum]
MKDNQITDDTVVTVTHPTSGRSFNLPTGLFINNKFVPSIAGQKFKTASLLILFAAIKVDPATGEVITEVYEALKEDVDVAVAAAKKAFSSWRKVPPTERAKLLFKLADLLEQNREEIACIESWDMGKVFSDAYNIDIPKGVAHIRYMAGWADKHHGKVVELDKDHFTYTRREPFGVCGQIVPWNFPLVMMLWKISPALATGNTVVLKTSEKTPLSALKFCQLIREAGFPEGTVNVLSGFGPTAGEAIARHMDIRKVAFTGSTAVGRRIMTAAATSNLKKVSLELGGKSPNIVFDDANLDMAVSAVFIGFTYNHGQICCAGTRVFVQEGIHDAFVAKLREQVKGVKIGGQFTDANHGPLVDDIQFKRVMGYIEDGKKAGAKVEIGGERVGDKGYFVAPTVFSDVKDDMKIAKEEIFGPVVVVMKFKTVEEMIQRANNSPYGLAAAIHTTNLSVAHKVAAELESGTVWVNEYHNLSELMPFGGYKESGFGRENSEAALEEYTQLKSVYIKLDDVPGIL